MEYVFVQETKKIKILYVFESNIKCEGIIRNWKWFFPRNKEYKNGEFVESNVKCEWEEIRNGRYIYPKNKENKNGLCKSNPQQSTVKCQVERVINGRCIYPQK